ncbi:putative DNA-binding protein ESCAROLA [Acorus gramineus]|uniref:DNA-binding protein ESCAROLA n=1 Tax=Acorus gramineus TaxID=55184 RepID=A0AAV9BD21_ACOGR|nr:putative DNA-binding protein ESCAROLA [Acorus gramineus]
MRPAVLELAAGTDVVEAASAFARLRRLDISVLSGSGAVSNVTLRHPTSASSVLTHHGRFDILSLSGTLFHPLLCRETGAFVGDITHRWSGAGHRGDHHGKRVKKTVKIDWWV